MSIDLITKVRRRLDVSHGELLVAVELADAANDFGDGISVGVDRLADRSRQDPRTVQRQLKRLREVGWLEIAEEGGMRGGRGRVTTYRISRAWIKGDTLPGFPDFTPKHYLREKGDNQSPIDPEQPVDSSAERVTKTGERVTNEALKGDRAVSPDPSTHLPSGAPVRAGEPSGPARGAVEPAADVPRGGKQAGKKPPPEPAPFDPVLSRSIWWNFVQNAIVSGAVAEEIAKYGATRIDDLPLYPRTLLQPIHVELTEWAVAEERSGWPNFTAKSRKGVEEEIDARVRRELKPLRPAPRSEAAA